MVFVIECVHACIVSCIFVSLSFRDVKMTVCLEGEVTLAAPHFFRKLFDSLDFVQDYGRIYSQGKNRGLDIVIVSLFVQHLLKPDVAGTTSARSLKRTAHWVVLGLQFLNIYSRPGHGGL